MVIMTEYTSSKNVHLHNGHLIVILFFVLCYANCSCRNKGHQDYFLLLLKIIYETYRVSVLLVLLHFLPIYPYKYHVSVCLKNVSKVTEAQFSFTALVFWAIIAF